MVVAAGGSGQPCGVFSRGCRGGDGVAGIAPGHGCGAGVGWVKPTMRRSGGGVVGCTRAKGVRKEHAVIDQILPAR